MIRAQRMVGLLVGRLLANGCSVVTVNQFESTFGFVVEKQGNIFGIEITQNKLLEGADNAEAFLADTVLRFNENFATVQKLKSAHIAPMSTTVN